jgi:rhamnosyltransferase
MQHVFIVGAKGFTYGGYETFLDKLTEYHKDNKDILYHIACKANGPGMTDETKLNEVQILSDTEYIYHNAHCFKIHSPELGNAQAIIYDIKALQYCCEYIKKNHIEHPIVYVLSSRVGPVMGYFAEKIHKLGGKYYNNPDGRESLRKKYHPIVRKYWALSERGMVKYSDLVICDSINIEKYIQEEYKQYHPKTTYIAYGSDVIPSTLADDDPKYVEWLNKFNLTPHSFYISVGRFVPENNFETMIREFMKSKTEKDFAIITTRDDKFLAELDQKLHFSQDKRIKFVGTVYDQELLKKIRENAYGYFHGHEVGGTNPSLLEALGATKLNLLYDVGFNREVAEDAALYWTKEDGNLAGLIDQTDQMAAGQIEKLGENAKARITLAYSWEYITEQYEKAFLKEENNMRKR